jgi:hypothetical protein
MMITLGNRAELSRQKICGRLFSECFFVVPADLRAITNSAHQSDRHVLYCRDTQRSYGGMCWWPALLTLMLTADARVHDAIFGCTHLAAGKAPPIHRQF